MLYYLSQFSHVCGPFRLFNYVTFRAGGAAATALILVLIFGPFTIKLLKRINATAPSRHKGLIPDEFIDSSKDKTPSMGGILIVISIVISTLLWAVPTNHMMIVFLFLLISLCGIGFLDDYAKIVHRNRDGISGKLKLTLQFTIAFVSVLSLCFLPRTGIILSQLMIPFIKEPLLTGFYGALITIPLGILVVVGSSNAVNLTDGKDGLAIGSVIFCALAYCAFAYLSGNFIFAKHLKNTLYCRSRGSRNIRGGYYWCRHWFSLVQLPSGIYVYGRYRQSCAWWINRADCCTCPAGINFASCRWCICYGGRFRYYSGYRL